MTSRPTRSYRGYDFSLTEKILGACIEVHRTLGPGFQEIIYQRALELELAAAGLEFEREVEVPCRDLQVELPRGIGRREAEHARGGRTGHREKRVGRLPHIDIDACVHRVERHSAPHALEREPAHRTLTDTELGASLTTAPGTVDTR